MKYQVIVGNIGTVADTDNRRAAFDCFLRYVDNSKSGYGREANEPVTLMEDGNPIHEHCPPEVIL